MENKSTSLWFTVRKVLLKKMTELFMLLMDSGYLPNALLGKNLIVSHKHDIIILGAVQEHISLYNVKKSVSKFNFSILDNLHNFEHYTYMTQTVIKALFINTVNYQKVRQLSANKDVYTKPRNACIFGAFVIRRCS